MATAEIVGPPDPQHYLWWFPGSPVKIHLALHVVHGLKFRMAGTTPATTEEGLLLGRTHEGATEILDFLPATKTPVSVMIAELDAERKRSLVGYYRTGKEELFQLNAQDLSLAREHFAKPYQVFLLVHPSSFGPPTATFFFHDRDSRMADFAFLEFPLDPSLLAAEQNDRIQRSQKAVGIPAPVQPEAPSAAAPEPLRRPHPSFILKAAGVACALALVFTLGLLVNSGLLRKSDSSVPQGSSRSGPPQAGSHPSMSLRATRRYGDLELTWNRDSPPIAAATSGLLSIQDGAFTRRIALDTTQLRNGSLLYAPSADQILMQLTVTNSMNSITESVTVILPHTGEPKTYPAPPPRTTPTTAVTATTPPPPTAVTTTTPAAPAPSAPATPLKQFQASALPPVKSASPPSVSLQEPPALNNSPTVLPIIPSLAASPIAPAATAPQSGLPLSSQAAKPIVTTYEPAVPVVKTTPVVSAELRNLIVAQTKVQVRVAIDKKGRVTKAEAIPQKNVSNYLLNSAADAARLWRFKPALSNHEPVECESVLQFAFER